MLLTISYATQYGLNTPKVAFASGCASIDLIAFSNDTPSGNPPAFIKMTAHIYWFGPERTEVH